MTNASGPADGGKVLIAETGAKAAGFRLEKTALNAVNAAAASNANATAAKGGGKLSRSETVTVRLDPKLRYLAELAARIHRRTLSSYIEWAIVGSLADNVIESDSSDPSGGPSINDKAEHLWDVDDADRFAKLALRYPHLLTHEEQVRWKLIRECYSLWGDGVPWDVDARGVSHLNFGMLRRNWDLLLKAAASGKTANDIELDLKR